MKYWNEDLGTYLYDQDTETDSQRDNSIIARSMNKEPTVCKLSTTTLKTMVPFVKDCVRFKTGSSVSILDIYARYLKYCEVKHYVPIKKIPFSTAFRRYVFRDKHIRDIFLYYSYAYVKDGKAGKSRTGKDVYPKGMRTKLIHYYNLEVI